MYNLYQDLIKQHIYHFPVSFFYLKDRVIVYEDHMYLLFSEFLNIVSILYDTLIEFITLLYRSLASELSIHNYQFYLMIIQILLLLLC